MGDDEKKLFRIAKNPFPVQPHHYLEGLQALLISSSRQNWRWLERIGEGRSTITSLILRCARARAWLSGFPN